MILYSADINRITAMSKVNKISIRDISRQNKYKIEDIFVYTPYEIYETQNTFITYVLSSIFRLFNASKINLMRSYKVQQVLVKLYLFYVLPSHGRIINNKHQIHLLLK